MDWYKDGFNLLEFNLPQCQTAQNPFAIILVIGNLSEILRKNKICCKYLYPRYRAANFFIKVAARFMPLASALINDVII